MSNVLIPALKKFLTGVCICMLICIQQGIDKCLKYTGFYSNARVHMSKKNLTGTPIPVGLYSDEGM